MEEKVITYLQNILNDIKESRENGSTEIEYFYQQQFVFCKSMAESLTGKHFQNISWKVYMED